MSKNHAVNWPEEQTFRDNTARAVKSSPKPQGTRMEKIRFVVDRKTASRIDGVFVDIQTAAMLLRVHENLNEKNREKFASLPLRKMVEVGWLLYVL